MRTIIFIAILVLASCRSVNYLDGYIISRKNEFRWHEEVDGLQYEFDVVFSNEHMFYGYFVINDLDSFFMRGYEKGNVHPTGFVLLKDSSYLKNYDRPVDQRTAFNQIYIDSLFYGSCFIVSINKGDTLLITDQDKGDTLKIPRDLKLVKIKK
jgi:hypothetical protein